MRAQFPVLLKNLTVRPDSKIFVTDAKHGTGIEELLDELYES